MIVVRGLRGLRAFVDFWLDFVVGDDWTVPASVLVAILATWGLGRAGPAARWLLPPAALGSTAVRRRRATRRAR